MVGEMKTTAETIAELSGELLLRQNGLLFGQCLTAVGWVGGTIPKLDESKGLIELSMADVSGASIAVGAALSDRRTIYVIRYQGFLWYNAASIVNYAAKSKEIWGRPCPILVRAIAMDGSIGPVASSAHHGMVGRMPGIVVAAPMTGSEWEFVYRWWLDHDDPVFVSESRKSFGFVGDLPDRLNVQGDVVLIGIGSTRLDVNDAAEQLESRGLQTSSFGLVWLKPLRFEDQLIQAASRARVVLVVDSDFENCSIGVTAAYQLQRLINKRVEVIGLEERTAGFSRDSDNTSPSVSKIVERVTTLFGERTGRLA